MINKEQPKKRTKCEIYSRVVGYIQPIQQWNEGKLAEFEDRKVFNVKKMMGSIFDNLNNNTPLESLTTCIKGNKMRGKE